MRVPSASSTVFAACGLAGLASASVHCDKVLAGGAKFDITALRGPHSVYAIDTKDTGYPSNTTFTFDLCHTLHHHREDDEKGCQRGSWACAFKRRYDPEKEETDSEVRDAWSIAGTFTGSGGQLEDTYERIKDSTSESDAEQDLEGVRIHLNGGKREGIPAKMIASLICDRDAKERLARRDNPDDSDEDEGMGSEKSKPELVRYDIEDTKGKSTHTLRIKWKTPHACEDAAGSGDGKSGGHWGFFTWFIIILFLLVAAYLIFGSWLNYNRHGARGWDLLPHGDTIRDVPYLVKDWGRAIVDTVQGSHSRGGYNQI